MVKLFGVCFLITGAVGFSFCLCREQKIRLMMLKEMRSIFFLVQKQIHYGGFPIDLILQEVSGKVKTPFSEALKRVSEQMCLEDGEEFCRIWTREMETVLFRIPITKEQKELMLGFPRLLNAIDREGQAQILCDYIDELDKWIVQTEKEEKDKNKLIMSLGTAAGILLSILLL